MKRLYLILLILLCFTTNVKSQWYQQSLPGNLNFLLSIKFTDILHGAACGYLNFNGRALYTNDSGHTWQIAQVPDSSRALTSIAFINSSTGYIAGAYNLPMNEHPKRKKIHNPSIELQLNRLGITEDDEYKGLFLKTTNGGVNWFTYGSLPDSVFYMISIHFINANTGIASVDYNSGAGTAAIIKTTNGGASWFKILTPSGINTLWKVKFVNSTKGFAVGYKNTSDTTFLAVMLTTSNTGETWTESNFSGLDNLTDISFNDDNSGYITGSGVNNGQEFSTILKTVNGGLFWSQIAPPVSNAITYNGINTVQGIGTAFCYGRTSPTSLFISKTENYGSNWLTFNLLNMNAEFTGSTLANNNNWYICGGYFGSNAVILKTTNAGGLIGVQNISSNVPSSFKLEQNYPNPFNPSTKIKFDVGPPLSSPPPRGGDSYSSSPPYEGRDRVVVLIIYDLLGREIETLVNQQLQPGTYEVEWDATNYPSGIYFYTLQTRDYKETKKMILIK